MRRRSAAGIVFLLGLGFADARAAAQPASTGVSPEPPAAAPATVASTTAAPATVASTTAAPATVAPPPVAPPPAQPPPPVAPPSVQPPPLEQPPPFNAVRPGASGFQIAFRLGAMFPLGEASGAATDDLARRYAWQVPFIVDVGGRFARSFFVGGYLGFGIGSTGSDARVDAACRDDDDNGKNDIACSASSFRVGIELQYSFAPDQRLNPWVGYGIGFEGARASIKDDYSGFDEADASTGITYADFTAGFDLRHKVGFGPFIDLALGQYRQTTTDLGQRGKYHYTIEDRALHAWLTLGFRFVVNP